jgi:cysteine-rich repeat protein
VVTVVRTPHLRQCDDGNIASGDGCSSACRLEADFVCVPGPGGSTDICHTGSASHVESFEGPLSAAWRFSLGSAYVRGAVVPDQGEFARGPPFRYAGNGGLRVRHDGTRRRSRRGVACPVDGGGGLEVTPCSLPPASPFSPTPLPHPVSARTRPLVCVPGCAWPRTRMHLSGRLRWLCMGPGALSCWGWWGVVCRCGPGQRLHPAGALHVVSGRRGRDAVRQ